MEIEQLQEIRRYLASFRAGQTVDVRAYATAISGSMEASTKELQQIIKNEAIALDVPWK